MDKSKAIVGTFIRVDFKNGVKYAQINDVSDDSFFACVLNKGAVRTGYGWNWNFKEDLSLIAVLPCRPSKDEVRATYP